MILENFSNATKPRAKEVKEGDVRLKRPHVVAFLKAWQQLAPNYSGYMPWRTLFRLLRKLEPPLGLGGARAMRGRLNAPTSHPPRPTACPSMSMTHCSRLSTVPDRYLTP